MHPGGGEKKHILPHAMPYPCFFFSASGVNSQLSSTRLAHCRRSLLPGCLLLAKVFKMPGMRVVLTISKPTVLRALRVGLISNVAWASNLATACPGPYLVSDATGQVSTENAQCDYCIAMSSSSSSSTATLRTMVHIHDDPLVGIYNGYG